MPPVIIAAAWAVGAISATQAIIAVASLAYGSYQRRKAKAQAREAYNASLQDRYVNDATTNGPRSVIYGRTRNADGVIFKATHGDKSQYYSRLIALAAHEVVAIETVYFNDAPVTLDSEGWVQNAPYARLRTESASIQAFNEPAVPESGYIYFPQSGIVEGSISVVQEGQQIPVTTIYSSPGVVTGLFFSGAVQGYVTVHYQFNVLVSRARVRKYPGAPAQDLSGVLGAMFPALVTPAHRFAGIPCVLVDLEYDQDAFPGGVPVVTAQVAGKRVFDPRNGSFAFSENPALIARDWALSELGGGATPDEIDEGAVVAAANACDVAHAFVRPSGVTMRTMFTCCMVCKPEADPADTLSEIVESMAGKWAWAGGRLRIKAGAYSAPVATLDESWCSGQGPIEVVSGQQRQSLVNIYKPVIADSALHYAVVPTAPVRAEAYISLDGQELPRDIPMAGVGDADHAQHIAGVLMRDARQSLTVKIPCNLRAYPVEVFDTISVTLPRFGWAAKAFEVLGWEFSQTGGVVLTLKETAAEIFNPDAAFSSADIAPNTQLPLPWIVAPITGLTVRSGSDQLMKQADGTVTSRALISWDPAVDQAVAVSGAIEVRYWLAAATDAQGASLEVPGGDTQVYIDGLIDGRQYLFKVRPRNALVRGNWTLQILHTIIGKTEPPADVSAFQVIENPGFSKSYIWDYPNPPRDLAGFMVRYSSGPNARSWEASVPLFEAGPLDRSKTISLPGDGAWCFLIRAVDTTGNLSIAAKAVSVTFDAGTFGVPLVRVDAETLLWPGTITDGNVDGYALIGRSTLTWDTIPELWENWLNWDGPSVGTLIYEHTVIDIGSVQNVLIRASSVAGGATITSYQESLDGITYSSWAAVPSNVRSVRYLKLRWLVTGGYPVIYKAGFNIYLSQG